MLEYQMIVDTASSQTFHYFPFFPYSPGSLHRENVVIEMGIPQLFIKIALHKW